MPNNQHQCNLTEGLRTNDLRDWVHDTFSIDRFKSKMGEDKDVAVLSFRVKEKYPAIDLMEFLEKGYNFILDADMSAGEERDGQYQVFAEVPRTAKLPGQIRELLSGMSQLCDCYNWKFRYHKAGGIVPFSEEKINQHVPLDPRAYDSKLLEMRNHEVSKFFNQGALDGLILESDGTITFKKLFFGDLRMKFVTMGRYDDMKDLCPGALNLDENGQSQVYFLQKYLGNYDIDKIGDKFLIRNGNKGLIAQKDSW